MPKETAEGPVLLQGTSLTTVFDLGGREAAAVRAISFEIRVGESLALVGESGSGKSVTALSLLGLVRPPGRVTGGSILWKGHDLARLDDTRLHAASSVLRRPRPARSVSTASRSARCRDSSCGNCAVPSNRCFRIPTRR